MNRTGRPHRYLSWVCCFMLATRTCSGTPLGKVQPHTPKPGPHPTACRTGLARTSGGCSLQMPTRPAFHAEGTPAREKPPKRSSQHPALSIVARETETCQRLGCVRGCVAVDTCKTHTARRCLGRSPTLLHHLSQGPEPQASMYCPSSVPCFALGSLF